MKKTISVVIMVLVFICVGICFAKRAVWDSTKRPGLSIVHGHARALDALGKTSDEFYCLSASISSNSWTYYFSSEQGDYRWVRVAFNGSTRVTHPPRDY